MRLGCFVVGMVGETHQKEPFALRELFVYTLHTHYELSNAFIFILRRRHFVPVLSVFTLRTTFPMLPDFRDLLEARRAVPAIRLLGLGRSNQARTVRTV